MAGITEPPRDCGLCPRLAGFRDRQRAAEPDWHNAPVPSFGPLDARLLIVGLAPGLRGANRTGRPFTGDSAGNLLYATLIDCGFASGRYDMRVDDGLTLIDCRVTNAVRCVPPQNRPLGAETNTCRSFLESEIAAMRHLSVVLALGGLAHNSIVRAFGRRPAEFKFAHGVAHVLEDGGPTLIDSYHCSRYNVNTGRLTEDMFRYAFAAVREALNRG